MGKMIIHPWFSMVFPWFFHVSPSIWDEPMLLHQATSAPSEARAAKAWLSCALRTPRFSIGIYHDLCSELIWRDEILGDVIIWDVPRIFH